MKPPIKSSIKLAFCSLIMLYVMMSVPCGIFFERHTQTASAQESTNGTIDNGTKTLPGESTEVFSYLTILDNYYQEARKDVEKDGLNFCTFEEFTDHFYELDLDIDEYTNMMTSLYKGEDVIPLSSSGSSSSGKSYTLTALSKTYNPEVTPGGVFATGTPKSSALMTDPLYTNIRAGDISVETRNTFAGAGHTALIYEVNKKISGNDVTYIQTIEAIDDKVYYGYIDQTRVIEYGIVIVRPVNLTATKIENAKAFCHEQLGKPYDFPVKTGRVNTSIDSEKWYCSELIYAAYKFVDISLYSPTSSDDWVLPFDIYYSNQVLYVPVLGCLDAKLINKEDGKWTMRVYNRSSKSIDCIYNEKMCFDDDAIGWTEKLSNKVSIKIPAYSYVNIKVSENWFATTIAISRTVGSYNCITYFNSLNNTTKRMQVGKNVISIGGGNKR